MLSVCVIQSRLSPCVSTSSVSSPSLLSLSPIIHFHISSPPVLLSRPLLSLSSIIHSHFPPHLHSSHSLLYGPTLPNRCPPHLSRNSFPFNTLSFPASAPLSSTTPFITFYLFFFFFTFMPSELTFHILLSLTHPPHPLPVLPPAHLSPRKTNSPNHDLPYSHNPSPSPLKIIPSYI